VHGGEQGLQQGVHENMAVAEEREAMRCAFLAGMAVGALAVVVGELVAVWW